MENKFNHTGHKKLWNWLADNPGKGKHDYFAEHGFYEDGIDTAPHDNCYACEYGVENRRSIKECICPLTGWGDVRCFNNNGLWNKFEEYLLIGEYDKACETARKIANLPLREGIVTE